MLRLFFVFILSILFFSANAFAKETLVINLSGIQAEALSNIKARLDVELEAYQGELTTMDIEHFYQAAPDYIKKALEPYGYFNATIDSHLKHHDTWTASFHITPGPSLRIENIHIMVKGPGENNKAIKKFVEHFPLHKNQTLTIASYEKVKDAFLEIINNQGYLKASWEKKEILIDRHHNTATITWCVNTGPPYFFGHIGFNQNAYSASFLKRFRTVQEGQPFSSLKLLQFQQDLSNSRYFQSVSVTPQLDQTEENKVPTNVDVTLPKSQQYNIGVGYGTFTGPRLTLGTDLRRIGDGGQHLTAQLKLSSVLSGLAAKYYIPGDNPLTDQYTIGLDIQRFMPKNGESLSETLSMAYLKEINKWHHSFSINALNDLYKKDDTDLRNSHLLYPSYNISHVASDNMLDPHHGHSFSLTVQGSSQNILSTTSFFQAEWKGKYIFSPTQNSRVILRSDIGYTVVKDLNQLPLTLNFFAGGLNSVRGYPFDSIGPGKYLRVGSVELQHKIVGDFSAAAFYDFGNAGDHFNEPLKKGDGLGMIYHSVIGPIKLYVGRGESKPGKSMSIEFSIGPEF